MPRFVDFLILVTLCFYLANLAIEDGSSASLVVPQSLIQTTAAAGVSRDENSSPTITVKQAENLIHLLPATVELHPNGMNKESGPMRNDKDSYFLWIYKATAQKTRDTRLIEAGRHMQEIWWSSDPLFSGDASGHSQSANR